MADAMDRVGFKDGRVNLDRWLFGEMYAPQDANIERIFRFCKGSGFPEDEIKRLTENIRRASSKAREKRKEAKAEVLAELARQNVLEHLRAHGDHAATLFKHKETVMLLQVDDHWTESGLFSQGDMYTISKT